VTWFEWLTPLAGPRARAGVLLEQTPGGTVAIATFFCGSSTREDVAVVALLPLPLSGSPRFGEIPAAPGSHDPAFTPTAVVAHVAHVYSLMLVVNSPRVVVQREHAPHRCLLRKLRTAGGKVPHQPLPWVE
jgi:hypothetical protein